MVIESSSLVSVLFMEVFSHPYFSFFHSPVNVFWVIYVHVYTDISSFQRHDLGFGGGGGGGGHASLTQIDSRSLTD